MTQIEEEQTRESMGRHYGYPKCCIDHFYDNYPIGVNVEKASAEERKLGLGGTGYHPCPECAQKPLDQIYLAITARRECEVPFPLVVADMAEDAINSTQVRALSRAIAFRRRLSKKFGPSVVERDLNDAIASLRHRLKNGNTETRVKKKLGEKVYILPSGNKYLVFGEKGFSRAEGVFRAGNPEDWFAKGFYPKTYPSVIAIDPHDSREPMPNGHGSYPVMWINCTNVHVWLQDIAADHPDAVEVLRVLKMVENGTAIEEETGSPKVYTQPNMEYVGGSSFLVRTQAGYRKALKDFLIGRGWSRKDIGEGIVDHRSGYGRYPAFVNFKLHYGGGVECLTQKWDDLNSLKAKLSDIKSRIAKLRKEN